mgnify:CR=1 FL=1
MSDNAQIESFIAEWAPTGGSELANTQSFVNGLCALIGVDPPKGSRTDDSHNDYVFERRVFQKEADGTESFGRIDAYKRHCFVLEAKQGSDADRKAAEQGEADLDIFGQTAATRFKRGTAKRGTPAWSKAMVEARGQGGFIAQSREFITPQVEAKKSTDANTKATEELTKTIAALKDVIAALGGGTNNAGFVG